MPGPVVTVGASVIVSPGAAGPTDTGVIISVPLPSILADGAPVATAGSMCQMINSSTGALYMLTVGQIASKTLKINSNAMLRVGDRIPSGHGVLQILGPPAAMCIMDNS
ncbi:hypothetical protein [Desulfosediminicola flagellatus]|uniref:hypothetical protein n=1 Tax=Desulfosediminicola flagellatus TaxID=2569541 RepID=UPI0010AD1D95|nr:hypothetical protein [Desulfosediminicola flagellatus]